MDLKDRVFLNNFLICQSLFEKHGKIEEKDMPTSFSHKFLRESLKRQENELE